MVSHKATKKVHPDSDLQMASDYLEYHTRMFVEALLWLRDSSAQGLPKDTIWNAVLEDYLVHARLLIHFICNSSARRDEDVIAVHYFHDLPGYYTPLTDAFLLDWAQKIGGNLVHITTKAMPALKSQQIWPVDEIADKLVPGLRMFLTAVPETRLAVGVRNDCMKHLSKLSRPVVPLSTNAAT
jgi:hypothetical protein